MNKYTTPAYILPSEHYFCELRAVEVRGNGPNATYGKGHKFTGSKPKGIDKSLNSGIIKSPTTPDEVSALRENYFEKVFSDNNLKQHWEGKSDHSKQYSEFTNAEQYNEYAKQIISSAADGKKILGYKMSDGTVCRYKVDTSDYVKGNPIYDDIYTCFKPDDKAAYFHNNKRKDGGITK